MKKTTAFAAAIALAGLLTYSLPAQEPPADSAAPAAATPPVFTPAQAATGQPQGQPPNRPTPFNVEMSAEFMRKVMETSAKIEAIKKEAAARRAEIFKTNGEIQDYQARMIKLQEQINAILSTDPELTKLEMERDIVWTTMPPMPGARMRAGVPPGMFPMMPNAAAAPQTK